MICDFAETYGILDIFGLSPGLVATLFFGLSEDSRTKRKLTGQKLTVEQTLLAMIVDGINLLVWSKTKDASNNQNKPESILALLREGEKETDYMVFDSLEEFEEMRQKIIGGK